MAEEDWAGLCSSERPFVMRSLLVVALVAVATLLHALAWYLTQSSVAPPDAGEIASLSFSPIDPDANGLVEGTNEAQIRSDLTAIAPYTRKIRTYSATNGMELVPGIAADFGLHVSQGIWLDGQQERDEREMESGVALAKRHTNIDSVIVGNETIYRQNLTVPELIAQIQRVKREVSVPVTTAEVWNIWLEHPELASSVDYLAVHILPYWEGLPGSAAVDHAAKIYEKLRQTYPGKRIVIAEFGWPSAGLNRKEAVPDPLTQAQVLRDFMARADAMGIDYSIVEAFDQPWKTFEGSVGPYWGVFDASRHPKFELAGTVAAQNWYLKAGAALGLGLLLSLAIFAIPGVRPVQAFVLAVTANAIGAWGSQVFDYWATHYFVFGSQLAMMIGALLLVPLIIIMRQRIEELAAILFGSGPRRLLAAAPATALNHAPFVSIHIPTCREPAEMLRETLDSVAKLDWPNFECVVVSNNTPDASLWRPVEEHCKALGPRFKFIHAERLEGFKAGALRLALAHSAPETEIIGVIDADYVVDPNWLKELVPAFVDASVGLVQAPQDHRDGGSSVTRALMNGEYAGFFDIGMVQRNEVNAIVTHGTMCLVRRAALEDAGSWSSDTIVEDTDLGLTLLARGWQSLYTRKRYGWGLLPNDFNAYKRQRHRWAYGGLQLIKKHWREFLPGRGHLTQQQRAAFLSGWLNWLGAEALGVVIAVLNLIWMPLVAFFHIAVPEAVLTLPVIATFVVMLLHFLVLYRARVEAPVMTSLGAALAAMSLQFTVGRAVAEGAFRDGLPFVRTAKGGGACWGEKFPALFEAVLGGLLVLGSITLYVTNDQNVREISIFSAVLLVQSLPFLAAAAIAALERTPLNAFRHLAEAWRACDLASAPTAGPRAHGRAARERRCRAWCRSS